MTNKCCKNKCILKRIKSWLKGEDIHYLERIDIENLRKELDLLYDEIYKITAIPKYK